MGEIANVLASYVPSENEAQTESDLVRPVLRVLGHDFEVQPALDTPHGTKFPDYVFYDDRASLDANKGKKLDEQSLAGRAFAVGDAKYFERPLDVSLGKSGSFDNRNPSFQISFYMQHSGAEWGILTNGRLWRLYHRDSAHRLDRFYEVDLPRLIEGGDAEAFLYFFAFFRREAFEDGGEFGLRGILAESEDYARSVGDSLKFQVYEALRHIAQGFLDHPRNGLDSDADTLRTVYDNSLITLYRMLFVLYAESRELLPVRESEMYRDTYSLHAIKREAAQGRPLLPGTTRLWGQLRELSGIISDGNPSLSVATFNGGLFDPQRHPFLENNAVGDRHLQLAVDKLSRVGGQFVDYRDLAERHLGTIYEGLLEYHLEALPESEDGWTVILLNEKGERKLTGAYYTPDFVVKHIVEKTIGPMLDEAVAGAETDEEKVACVLGLDVLDPSMGSGHFLVEATEYIARFLVEMDVSGDGYSDDGEAELAYWKRRVAQSCVYGVDLNPLAVDLAKLSLWLATVAKDRPLSFLDHHLRCGNSLVGSRISELEPRGTTRKRRTKKQAEDSSQLSMLDDDSFRLSMSNAVGSMWLIEESPADTVEEVREQERLYGKLRGDLTRRYARLADLATATNFGVDVDATLWKPLADYATKPTAATLPQFQRWLDEARDVARERRFFHWELEFPEVFFDRQGRPLGEDSGFDVVVGNPPYVRQEVLGREMKGYFEAAYPETYHGVADLFVYFYQQGFRHLRRGGRMGYIVTNKWLRAGFGEPLRRYFAGSGAVEEIVDFGHAPIFPDADVFPCILILHKPDMDGETNDTVRVTEFPREALGTFGIEEYAAEHGHTVPKSRFTNAAWSLETSDVDDLMAKLREKGIPLAEFAGVKPAYGIKTGLNEAFLIDTATKERLVGEDPRSAEVIKPYLRGQDIKRWSPEWKNMWMIVMKSSGDHAWPWSGAAGNTDEAEEIFRKTFPAIHAHMKPLEARLRKRSDKGRNWWELRSCDYYELFEGPKIIHTDITWRPQFAFTDEPTYLVNTAYMWPTSDPWILAVVNSPLMWSYMWRNATHGKDEALRLIYSFVEIVPIAPPTDEVREEAEGIVSELIAAAKAGVETRRRALDWLAVEFGIEKPGKKLEDIAAISPDDFITEVRKRRPKSEGRLTPGKLSDLRSGYEELAIPAKEARRKSALLERRLTDLVNEAYGLTEEEISLMWNTAPPRMPGF